MPVPAIGFPGITSLSAEEVANPAQVLLGFFEFAHLHQVKEMLANVRDIVLTKKFAHKNYYSREEDEMSYFFEQLEKLIEASHLLKALD